MVFLTVSNDFTASDNPIIKRPFYTFYLYENEVIALDRLAVLTRGYIMSDFIACKYLANGNWSKRSHILEVDAKRNEFLKNGVDNIILIRNKELTKRPLMLYTSSDGEFHFKPSMVAQLDYYDNNMPLWETINVYNKIYDSGAVIALN